MHLAFHESLKKLVERWDHGGRENVCHPFKMLASRTKIYVAFLNNYQKALEALHRCTEAYPPFADLTRSIKLRSVKGQRQGQSLSLEDLLHKPVGRIQKHCLCLQVRTVMEFQAYFLFKLANMATYGNYFFCSMGMGLCKWEVLE